MKKHEKFVVSLSFVLSLVLGVTQGSSAMHIMEGFLPVVHSVAWGIFSFPFVVLGYLKLKKTLEDHPKAVLLLAMVGAYAFILSALKIPSVTGSSSHPTGVGLGAILFGATPMALISVMVLLFQAVLLAHGGLTTLGANTMSMGIVGPLVTVGVYRLLRGAKLNKNVAVFVGVALGDLLTYVVTAFQLALAHGGGDFVGTFSKFLTVFAVTQVPLAIIEGLLAVVVMTTLESLAAPELRDLGYLGG